MVNQEIQYFKFMGVKVDNVNYEEICKKIRENINAKGYICVTCVHTVMFASKDKTLFEAINASLLSIADGMPLAWYGKLLGCRTAERVSGPELMRRFLEEQNDYKHFLLGDTDLTINRVIQKAKRSRADIQITGYSPPFTNEFSEDDNKEILDRINAKNPDIIWVSFGAGKQDKWMYQNVHKLNRGIMIGVGAAFKFYIGKVKAPPKIFQDLGLQWFFRMAYDQDSMRILRSQVVIFPRFLIHFPLQVIKAREEAKIIKSKSSDSHTTES